MKAILATPALALALATAASAQPQYPGGPPPPQGQGQGYGQQYGPGGGGWDQAPGEFNDIQRQGFHDGIEAARRDFHDGRQPGPEQHREFRHPQVPPPAQHDFREAFRRGYGMAMHHMRDGGGPR